MSTVELQEIREKADLALRSAEADANASPVLTAVVRELAAKAAKALDLAGGDREWEGLLEVEQAGDSAKGDRLVDPGRPPRSLHAEGGHGADGQVATQPEIKAADGSSAVRFGGGGTADDLRALHRHRRLDGAVQLPRRHGG
jgi:hypothetical protein